MWRTLVTKRRISDKYVYSTICYKYFSAFEGPFIFRKSTSWLTIFLIQRKSLNGKNIFFHAQLLPNGPLNADHFLAISWVNCLKIPAFTCYQFTVWIFQDFSVTQILREINFGEFRSSKTAIFAIKGALNFVYLVDISLQKWKQIIKCKI